MAAGGTPVLQAEGLVKRFAHARAVDGVSITLHPGDCLALFGPNGAGKTTLLRLLGGLLKPTSGTITPAPDVLRPDAGMISHHTMLYDALTARENVALAARLYGRGDTEAALRRIGAERYAGRRISALSRGMRQRVSIARATVHGPRILLADEPYTGLDASGAQALTRLLVDARDAGAAIVIVTHNIEEGLAIATQSALMVSGRFVRTDAAPTDVSEYRASYHALVAGE